MSTRNLDALFEPRAIALFGASNQVGSVGQVLARNLLESGFAGAVMPVNPHEKAIRSAVAYHGVADLPETPDLAVIATPAPTVPGLIGELGARGCRAAVVISAGFEGGPESAALRQAVLDAARPHLLRVVGPNCLGVLSPGRGVNASFAHLMPRAGGLALVSQSGAIAAAALDWADARGLGFSHIVTVGDALDVDIGDLLGYLAYDPATTAILLYVESVTDARKFMTAARAAALAKPVAAIKAGSSASGAKAAFSHTGALAGADAVYDAAFRRAGILRVGDLRELLDAAGTLGAGLRLEGERLAILTNGGGAGVLAADALESRGGRLAELSAPTLEAIGAAVSANWSRRNPVDILGDAKPEAYGSVLRTLLDAPEVDAVLAMNCPTAVTDSTGAARAVAEVKASKPVLACWLGAAAVADGRRVLAAADIPAFETPDEAVGGFLQLVERRRRQAPPPLAPQAPAQVYDIAAAYRIVDQALADGRAHLTDPEARAVLAAYGVPVIESRTAATPREAGAAAEAMGGGVALKILSRDISHKTDAGGVALGLSGAAAVEAAATAMLARIMAAQPQATLEGFVVQPMIVRPRSHELLVGIAQDPAFGPVVLFGHGGIAAEVLADRCVGLPPLDDRLAREMISRTRVSRLLAGYRDRPPVKLQAVCDVLTALSRLAADLPEVVELDINPLLADENGVLALDARIAVKPVDAATPRLAIAPSGDQI